MRHVGTKRAGAVIGLVARMVRRMKGDPGDDREDRSRDKGAVHSSLDIGK
jgi:hypothetical protein